VSYIQSLPRRDFQDVDITDWPEDEKALLKSRLEQINKERKGENEIRELYKQTILMESLHFYRNVPLFLTPWSPVSMEIERGLDTAREIVTIPDDINREGLPALCYVWMVMTTASPRVQVGETERDE
jgi:hypothetical protein